MSGARPSASLIRLQVRFTAHAPRDADATPAGTQHSYRAMRSGCLTREQDAAFVDFDRETLNATAKETLLCVTRRQHPRTCYFTEAGRHPFCYAGVNILTHGRQI